MSLFEIELPPTKPATEWVRGRAVQKMMPTYDHAIVQRLFLTALGEWSDRGEYGRVAPEWGFRIAPPDGIVRPMVPDIAYVSFDMLSHDAPREAIQTPHVAPTVAVEVVCPEDGRLDINDKVATYLESGSELVIVVDLRSETIEVHDEDVMSVLGAGDVLEHATLPEFSLDVRSLFARARG